MFGVLALLFILVPIAELAVIVQIAGGLGVPATLLSLLVASIVGAWLVKRQGLAALGRVQAELAAGRVPTAGLADGMMILFAGALLLTPGFLTDAVGLALLLPPVRALARTVLARRFQRRVVRLADTPPGGGSFTVFDLSGRGFPGPPFGGAGTGRGGRGTVIDVDGDELPPRRNLDSPGPDVSD
ncbi:MAG: FxsA family protein [Acidimicrobiia bacterium]|nr:FxsA family protein [Acidimicrobiia bacterium]